MNNGVITIAIHKEIYYHWAEVLFKSILLYTDVEFALVYDNEEWFKKYNLNKLVKYPIYNTDVKNPYIFKYELINYSPFDNTIFFDADTIIFKDITPLFNEQFLSICGEWDSDWIYNEFSPLTPDIDKLIKKYNLSKLYSAYSGYIRFEKTNFYYLLFNNVLSNHHFDRKIYNIYGRDHMPDEYFLNISISELDLNRFIPIKLYFAKSKDDINGYYGFTFQGNRDFKIKNLESMITNTIKKIGINYYDLVSTKIKCKKELL
jgi:hypothetical protein